MSIEFGTMLSGSHIAVRVSRKVQGTDQWKLDMPVRDRKYGVIAPVSWNTKFELLSDWAPKDQSGQYKEKYFRWAAVEYEWNNGLYLGKVRKQEGAYEYIDYDSGYVLNHYGLKNVVLGCVALKGSRDGFVLAYVPLDYRTGQARDSIVIDKELVSA